MVHKKIWALLDERQGNTSQTLGVAEALGVPFIIKQIGFTPWIRIPNLFINRSAIGISPESRAELTPPWPDIVIVTARRLGIVASYIKSKNPSTFIAQIQWPGTPSSHFDFIAAPQHDGVAPARNVFITLGAPHRVTAATLAAEAEIWRPKLTHLSAPRIAVLVGGSSRGGVFATRHAQELAKRASELAKQLGGSFMVTTSRRTGGEVEATLTSSLTAPHYLHNWGEQPAQSPNPFYAFLGLADIIIVTGDSISMCSEACATGKPVYIYTSEDFVPPKHRKFIHALFEQGYASPLESLDDALFTPISALNETGAIANEIKHRTGL